MKFSIITPTHKRADLLTRAVESVLHQTYTDWEMIIVNDSPADTAYESFFSAINDSRIRYLVNETNRGVNYSRNRAMDNASPDSDWVIFLDDDDYLAPDALQALYDLALSHQKIKWFVTNRAYANGKLITNYPKKDKLYSYIWDCLILKKCRGDVTHCIEAKLIKNIRYAKRIKQAEEWLFYYQIALSEKMYYHSHNSTLTDGYDKTSGLNFRKRTRSDQWETFKAFIHEGNELHLLYHPTFIIYLFMRLVRLCVKV